MARIITIAMQKGGVGKTTTTVNLSAALATLNHRVLAIDLDPQGNLTEHVGFDPEQVKPTIYDVLRMELDGQGSDVAAAILSSEEGFDLVPSQPELSLVELSLMNALSRERILATILDDVKPEYDFILIDCSPSLNLLVINALTAADSVIIPIQTEYLAARGAKVVVEQYHGSARRNQWRGHMAVKQLIDCNRAPVTAMNKNMYRGFVPGCWKNIKN